MIDRRFHSLPGVRPRSAGVCIGLFLIGFTAACSGLLDVPLPGRIPAEQIDNPEFAAVLARSVIGDFECAYNNYSGGSSVHSDEWESTSGDARIASWGERTITADEDQYVIGSCPGEGFGMQTTLHTARYQAEDVFRRLQAWTDQQVSNRTSLMASVRAYGGYVYALMGETFCEAAFDKGSAQAPSAALLIAEQQFGEAITLAQQSGNTDMLNLARVGLARATLAQKKFTQAAQAAGQVPAGYEKSADRGAENVRRWNKFVRYVNDGGAYTAATSYRGLNDPRVPVVDAGRGSVDSRIRLWITTKYQTLATPIRLASYRQAQLILAEAQAEQAQVAQAMTIINDRRTGLGLSTLTANSQAEAVAHIIAERQKELAFEGGHRLFDLLRKNIAWKVGGNPFTGRPYGATRCWPLPTREKSGV